MTGKTYVTNAEAVQATNVDEVDNRPIDIEQPTMRERGMSFPQMVARRKSDEIISSAWLKRLGIDFPLFTDDMMKQYQDSNVEVFNPFVFVPTVLTLHIWIVVGDGLAGFSVNGGK